MPETVNTWLAVFGAIGGFLSALIVWGFASGRFIQKRTDEVDDIRRRQSAIAERVTRLDGGILEQEKARAKLADDTTRDVGRLQFKHELIEQRMTLKETHADERHERVDDRLSKLEEQVLTIQRQLDHLR